MINDNLKQCLAEIISESVSSVDSSREFLISEIPQVVQQVLLWQAATSFLTNILCVFLLVILVKGYNRIWCFFNDPDTIALDRGLSAIPFLIAAMFITLSFFHSFDWLKIVISPKLYLVEYADNLIS